MKLTRIIAAALAAGTVAAPAVANDGAVDTYAHTGSKGKLAVTLYGQVNALMMYVDDGVNSGTFFGMNDASSDRLGLKAKGKIDDNWSGGAKIEYEFEHQASDKFRFDNAAEDTGVQPNMRKLEFWLTHKQFGQVSLGLGDTASNGAAESDLSGTKNIGYANIDAHLEDMSVFNEANDTDTGLDIEEFIKVDDGHSRQRRIRYDSPSIAGFTLSGSWGRHEKATDARNGSGQKDIADVALRYSGEVEGIKIKAAAAMAFNREGVKDDDLTDISASALLPGGINLTAAWENRDRPGAGGESDVYYTKLGYQTKALCDWGKTSFAGEYSWSDDFGGVQGREGKVIGAGLVQKIDGLHAELYTGWRRYSFDDNTGVDYYDIDSFTFGGKIKL